jgi:hypothetical protein
MVSLQGRVAELEDVVMEESDDAKGEVVSSSSSDLDPVKNMVAIPVPGPSIVQTLILVDFVPPSLHSSLSPYVAAVEDDPSHDGVPEYWVDPDV